MVRILLAVALVLICVPCFAQVKKKGPAKDQDHEVYVGDRYVLTVPVTSAIDRIEGVELAKSIEAGDKEGIAAMLDEKRAVVLEPGTTVVVLELFYEATFKDSKSHECRIIKDGKAIAKQPIHYSWFTTKQMKKEPKPK